MSFSIVSNSLYSYIDESKIHELLKCKICIKPFVDPVSTQNGDRFCRSCILDTVCQNPNGECDQQLSELGTLTPITEKLVLDMLNSLLVQCTKCEKTNLMRGQLEEHENTSCVQATVVCSAADIKCSWVGARDDLNDHVEICKFQPLRSALGFIFTEHDQLKNRLENLETQINQLISVRIIDQIDLQS